MTMIECPWCDAPARLDEPDASGLQCEACGIREVVAADPVARPETIAPAA
jgi:hypothetical protein